MKKTFFANGQHDWDRNDTLILMYYFKVVKQNTSFENDEVFVDHDDVEKQIQQEIGLSVSEIAENIIGCSLGALKIQAQVLEFYMDGKDSGFKNGNQYQIELSKIHKNTSVDKLREIVNTIITNIENDADRIFQNKIAKELRENTIKENKRKREFKKQEQINKENLLKTLKQNNIEKAKALSEIKDVIISINTIINHPKFGKGVVVDVDSKISTVEFNNEKKKMANFFLEKIAE